MKFSTVLLFAAGAAAADWNAIARAVVTQSADGQPAYPAGNGTMPAATGTVGGGAAGTGSMSPSATSASPSQVTTNAADSLSLPYVGAGLAGIAAVLAL